MNYHQILPSILEMWVKISTLAQISEDCPSFSVWYLLSGTEDVIHNIWQASTSMTLWELNSMVIFKWVFQCTYHNLAFYILRIRPRVHVAEQYASTYVVTNKEQLSYSTARITQDLLTVNESHSHLTQTKHAALLFTVLQRFSLTAIPHWVTKLSSDNDR